MDFSNEERRLISYFAVNAHDTVRRLSFYAAVLTPIVLFATYGLFRLDIIAVSVAFTGLLTYQFWRISAEIKNAKLLHSICKKMEDIRLGVNQQ